MTVYFTKNYDLILFHFNVKKLNMNACTQAAIRFLTGKNKILQWYPNGHSFVYTEMQNFENVPKRSFVFYNEIQI